MLQLPSSAIQRHDERPFVFVATEDDRFERRDVELGRVFAQQVEITAGLIDGEMVVVAGGFALKSELLSELMEE